MSSQDESGGPLQEDGPVGEYNRANRSLGHFVENSAGHAMEDGSGWSGTNSVDVFFWFG